MYTICFLELIFYARLLCATYTSRSVADVVISHLDAVLLQCFFFITFGWTLSPAPLAPRSGFRHPSIVMHSKHVGNFCFVLFCFFHPLRVATTDTDQSQYYHYCSHLNSSAPIIPFVSTLPSEPSIDISRGSGLITSTTLTTRTIVQVLYNANAIPYQAHPSTMKNYPVVREYSEPAMTAPTVLRQRTETIEINKL